MKKLLFAQARLVYVNTREAASSAPPPVPEAPKNAPPSGPVSPEAAPSAAKEEGKAATDSGLNALQQIDASDRNMLRAKVDQKYQAVLTELEKDHDDDLVQAHLEQITDFAKTLQASPARNDILYRLQELSNQADGFWHVSDQGTTLKHVFDIARDVEQYANSLKDAKIDRTEMVRALYTMDSVHEQSSDEDLIARARILQEARNSSSIALMTEALSADDKLSRWYDSPATKDQADAMSLLIGQRQAENAIHARAAAEGQTQTVAGDGKARPTGATGLMVDALSKNGPSVVRQDAGKAAGKDIMGPPAPAAKEKPQEDLKMKELQKFSRMLQFAEKNKLDLGALFNDGKFDAKQEGSAQRLIAEVRKVQGEINLLIEKDKKGDKLLMLNPDGELGDKTLAGIRRYKTDLFAKLKPEEAKAAPLPAEAKKEAPLKFGDISNPMPGDIFILNRDPLNGMLGGDNVLVQVIRREGNRAFIKSENGLTNMVDINNLRKGYKPEDPLPENYKHRLAAAERHEKELEAAPSLATNVDSPAKDSLIRLVKRGTGELKASNGEILKDKQVVKVSDTTATQITFVTEQGNKFTLDKGRGNFALIDDDDESARIRFARAEKAAQAAKQEVVVANPHGAPGRGTPSAPDRKVSA